MTKLLGLPSWQPSVLNENGTKLRVVLEGGSIDADGAGTLLTTEECLLSEVQQRNPGVSREQLEQAFSRYLGIDRVIWLNRGIAGDDTHGHVDDIARFVRRETIVAAVEPDANDANHAPLNENLARLKQARTPEGQPYTVVELPMPRPVVFLGHACRPAMRISTSPTGWCWFPPFTIPTTAWRSTFWPKFSRTAK